MKIIQTKWLAVLCAAAMSVGLLVGCGQPRQDATSDTIRLAYVNWAEGVAVTHLMTVLLEDMGYNVEATMADVAPIYSSVAQGNQDIMIETWLPHTHAAYFERFGNQVELISTWYDEARIGLVVPEFVTIDSIADMNQYRDQFNGRITGIDAGAGIMASAENAIESYGLDFELLASSEAAMTAALQNAIDNGDWIVVTGWSPHWKFARFDLKYLEDPHGDFGATELVHSAARLGFSADFPEVAALFQNMTFNAEEIGSLMDIMDGVPDGGEERAVRSWIEDNAELVASWQP